MTTLKIWLTLGLGMAVLVVLFMAFSAPDKPGGVATLNQNPAPPSTIPPAPPASVPAKKPKKFMPHSNQNDEAEETVSVNSAVLSVDAYWKALNNLKDHEGNQTVESVYRLGLKAASDLMYAVDLMDGGTFQSVSEKMEGFVQNRDEVYSVYPDEDYFAQLANAYGAYADRLYFQILGEHSAQGLSNYQQKVTEYYSCTKFGEGLILTAYTDWSNYQEQFPHSYRPEVTDKLDQIVEEITKNDCICGEVKGVLTELRQFLQTFPNMKLSGSIKSRIDNIKSGREKLRLNCSA